jgi:hypothetical protein
MRKIYFLFISAAPPFFSWQQQTVLLRNPHSCKLDMLSGTTDNPVPTATALIHNLTCANSNSAYAQHNRCQQQQHSYKHNLCQQQQINFFISSNMVTAPTTSSCTNNRHISSHRITADHNKKDSCTYKKITPASKTKYSTT